MSGKGVKFLSGPRISIKFGNQTMAYAIGLNLSVSAQVIPVVTLSRYDPSSLEPVAYGLVRGSMTVVKINSNNSDKNFLPTSTNLGAGSDLDSHLNPSTVMLSQSFDLSVQVATPIQIDGKNVFSQFEFLTVLDCRLSSHSGAVSVAQLLNDTVSFEGLILIDDTTNKENIDSPIPT